MADAVNPERRGKTRAFFLLLIPLEFLSVPGLKTKKGPLDHMVEGPPELLVASFLRLALWLDEREVTADGGIADRIHAVDDVMDRTAGHVAKGCLQGGGQWAPSTVVGVAAEFDLAGASLGQRPGDRGGITRQRCGDLAQDNRRTRVERGEAVLGRRTIRSGNIGRVRNEVVGCIRLQASQSHAVAGGQSVLHRTGLSQGWCCAVSYKRIRLLIGGPGDDRARTSNAPGNDGGDDWRRRRSGSSEREVGRG